MLLDEEAHDSLARVDHVREVDVSKVRPPMHTRDTEEEVRAHACEGDV